MINLAEAETEVEPAAIGICPICGDSLYRDYMSHIVARHPDYQDVNEVEPLVELGRRITGLIARAERAGDDDLVNELLRLKDQVNKQRGSYAEA